MTDSIAEASDFLVPRDNESNRLPVTEETYKGLTIKHIPLSEGDILEYLGENWQEDGGLSDLEDEVIAKIIDEFLVEPDLSEDEEFDKEFMYQNMRPEKSFELILAILKGSGINIDYDMLKEEMSPETNSVSDKEEQKKMTSDSES